MQRVKLLSGWSKTSYQSMTTRKKKHLLGSYKQNSFQSSQRTGKQSRSNLPERKNFIQHLLYSVETLFWRVNRAYRKTTQDPLSQKTKTSEESSWSLTKLRWQNPEIQKFNTPNGYHQIKYDYTCGQERLNTAGLGCSNPAHFKGRSVCWIDFRWLLGDNLWALGMVCLIRVLFVCHEKCWAGWSTSWNQDCREKYQ